MTFDELLAPLEHWGIPAVSVALLTALAVWVALRAIPDRSSTRIYRQLAVVGLLLGANVLLVLALPLSSELQGQLLSLFGLALTAIIALSSTTLVANAMAGVMLRAVGSFHPGDFISVEDRFGRVTVQGLLHTELQTEDRDLLTLPNAFLIARPVKVVSATGTLISADVSLGYDAPRQAVRERLLEGAREAGLEDPFVQIKALLDHAVAYRVSGFLKDVGSLVSKRTELNARVLDSLHRGGIEIVSPAFMNQRPIDSTPVRPAVVASAEPEADGAAPEQLMFDKAEMAGRVTRLTQQRDEVAAEIRQLEQQKPEDGSGAASEIAWRKRQLATLDEVIAALHNE